MKKTLCLFLVFILMVSCLYSQSITKIAPQEQEQKTKNLEFQLWKEEIEFSKRERRTGRILLYSGMGVAVSGGVLLAIGLQTEEVGLWGISVTRRPYDALKWAGIISIGTGLVMAIGGSMKKADAQDRIDELMEEGERKGFLTYSYNPATQTIYIGYKIKF